MDFNTITQFITAVGFPIFMCVYLVHFMETEQKEMREIIAELKGSIDRLNDRLKIREEDHA